ncbi:MFS transporter [Neorhizobium sp. P12A]|uniref:MFS transporter n=1 Tax=Rhizobium/Agrobacterium group TaxID=227290 RepID=UPI0010485AA0|nr:MULTISPECIES: MFS transporter [Rhizobium/Agrobacterium group]KAA0685683.1 MFS transporter [Neorhizobium sp. P12A]TCR71465.1 FSR family fosmidomycin resistance protein-like MFS transporter [Rhizobium sp. BK376]
MTATTPSATGPADAQISSRPRVYLSVLAALGLSHLCNDTIQSLIPAVYPILKTEFALDFVQIGVITLVFQIAGALFQPAIGLYTDRRPMPYSAVFGMAFTLAGLVSLAYASSYVSILASVTLVGVGSSIFHPEATRAARYASGGRQGLAQGIFQVGGQVGGALGPLCAAIFIVSNGRHSLVFFTAMVLLAMMLLTWSARQYWSIQSQFEARSKNGRHARSEYPRKTVIIGLAVLTLLMTSKLSYLESFRSFYTFYLIDRFGVSVPTSQIMLFVFFISSAAGVLLGGIVGDRIGRYRIIWISVLGPLPFTLLLPYADLFWTGVLTVVINLIMASAFASIMIYAMDLVPKRIGLIGGMFYGLNFAIGGVAAAFLGGLSDSIGIESVYKICSVFPIAGLLAILLPRLEATR